MAKLYLQISIPANMFMPPQTPLRQKHEEIADECLRYLPPYTTLYSIQPLSIIGLSIPYMVIYNCPSLDCDADLNCIFRREVLVDPINNYFHEWEILTSIEYLWRPATPTSHIQPNHNSIQTPQLPIQPSFPGISHIPITVHIDGVKVKECDHVWKGNRCKHCKKVWV